MKKIFIPLLLVMTLSACIKNVATDPSKKEILDLGTHMKYAHDAKTGLCFTVTQSLGAQGFTQTSMACVPCDSLKKVTIIEIQ